MIKKLELRIVREEFEKLWDRIGNMSCECESGSTTTTTTTTSSVSNTYDGGSILMLPADIGGVADQDLGGL